jgi:lysophospholipase L1-like esterase
MRKALMAFILSLSAGFLLAADPALQSDRKNTPAIKSGQTIIFVGGPLTAHADGPKGYLALVNAGLKANGIIVETKGHVVGGGGSTSDKALKDIKGWPLSDEGAYLMIMIGVQDCFHRGYPAKDSEPTPLEEYKKNMAAIVESARAAKLNAMIITEPTAGENLNDEDNKKLAPYNEILRALARDKKCGLVDVNKAFEAAIKASRNPGGAFIGDKLHAGPKGQQVVAECILRALNLNEAQMKKAQEAWGAPALLTSETGSDSPEKPVPDKTVPARTNDNK